MTEEKAYLILRGFLVWDVEMSPTKVAGASGTYQITVTNSGNTDIRLILEGKDPEEALEYTFRHDKVIVPAGESVLITLQVRPKQGQKEKLYSFRVLVRPAEAKVSSKEAKTMDGQLDYQLRHWPWKWILLGLAIVAAALLIWKLVPPLLNPPAPVINSFTANPESVTAGGSSILSWDVSGADVVNIDQQIGTVNSTGNCTVSPATTTIYTLEASNKVGSVTATVQVAALPVINSFTADPTSIASGGGSTLRWDVSGATEVTIDPLTESFAPTGTRTVSPTTTTTYTLTASNEAGSSTAAVQVTVSVPVIEYFTADPASFTVGDGSTLSWSVSGATEVTIDQGIGSVTPTGTRMVSPTTITTYTLTASNEEGSSTATVQVTVSAAPLPPLPAINDFTADPTSIAPGGSSTLSWSVSGADEVTIDRGIGSVGLTGTRTVSPATTTIYTLTASNEAGSSTATVQVTEITTPVISYFTADPTSIATGDSSTLSWSVSGADEVTIDHGIGSVGLTGTRTVSPTTTTTYTLTASNEAGDSTATVQVTMTLPVIEYFTADPPYSCYCGAPDKTTVTLIWSVSGATSVTIDHGIGSVPPTGTRTVPCPANFGDTVTYTLTASNGEGTSTAEVQVMNVHMPWG
jgi:hypothetical protein